MSSHTDTSQPLFADRHVGPDAAELDRILAVVGVSSLEELAAAAVPGTIADAVQDGITAGIDVLPQPLTEEQATARLRELADANTVHRSMIGLGYYGTHTPGVIRRNVLENPAWYTAYTPYQPEISQGRLEALLNFQTMVADLTGMEVANASMLDEATAAAEAMTLMLRATKNKSRRLVVDADLYPLQAVYAAAYIFIDRCYVFLDRPAADAIRDVKKHVTDNQIESTASGAMYGLIGNLPERSDADEFLRTFLDGFDG
mgnify:CR=1 FL=1